MKYWIISIGLIFYGHSFYTQKKDTTVIIWDKNYKLKWGDFQGKPKRNSKLDAVTYAGIRNASYTHSNGKIVMYISVFFDKKRSWVKDSNNASSTLLEHEQIHFDITELYGRKLRKAILETTFKVKRNKKTEKKFLKICNKILKEKDTYQDMYDKETMRSINGGKQKEWAEKVAKELAELEEYANPEIVIDLNKKKKKNK